MLKTKNKVALLSSGEKYITFSLFPKIIILENLSFKIKCLFMYIIESVIKNSGRPLKLIKVFSGRDGSPLAYIFDYSVIFIIIIVIIIIIIILREE